MLELENTNRRTRLEAGLKDLCYRRIILQRELEALDQQILKFEGSIAENEATRRDITTEAAIVKAATPPKEGT
jgi:prefoldin subunit 5